VEPVGHLGRLIDAYRQSVPYPPSGRQLARDVGVSASALSGWRRGEHLPTPDHLRRLAKVIRTPYRRVMAAALIDAGYFPPPRS